MLLPGATLWLEGEPEIEKSACPAPSCTKVATDGTPALFSKNSMYHPRRGNVAVGWSSNGQRSRSGGKRHPHQALIHIEGVGYCTIPDQNHGRDVCCIRRLNRERVTP